MQIKMKILPRGSHISNIFEQPTVLRLKLLFFEINFLVLRHGIWRILFCRLHAFARPDLLVVKIKIPHTSSRLAFDEDFLCKSCRNLIVFNELLFRTQ